MNRFLSVLLLGFLLLPSCITEVDFEEKETQFIAINGIISNNPGERSITFYENVPTARSIEGTLYKNGNPEAVLEEVNSRTLALPNALELEAGATYHVEITTSDGELYRSQPQEVQAPRDVQTLSMELVFRSIPTENNPDVLVETPFLDLFATIPLTDQEAPLFLRFQIDESWAYREVDDQRIEGDPLFLCYIERGISTFPTSVWSSGGVSGPEAVAQVGTREVDQSFLLKHYLNVYTYVINEQAYNYYLNAQTLVSNTGTLVDEIPAALRGNLEDANDPEELVYGLVEFALADTARLAINGVNARIVNNCEGPEPCPPPRPDGSLPFCPCANCLLIEGASYDKPDYFVE